MFRITDSATSTAACIAMSAAPSMTTTRRNSPRGGNVRAYSAQPISTAAVSTCEALPLMIPVEAESDQRLSEQQGLPSGEQVGDPVQQPREKDRSRTRSACRGVERRSESTADQHRRDGVREHRGPRALLGDHQHQLQPVGTERGEDERDDRKARLASRQRERDGGVAGVHVSGSSSPSADSRQAPDPRILFLDVRREASQSPVGEPHDQHRSEQRGHQLQRMQSPAVVLREEGGQSLDRLHSGVRRRSAASLRAALAQRGARRELRTAAPAQRVDANALRRHLTENRTLHRYEEWQRGDGWRDRRTAEAAPSSP